MARHCPTALLLVACLSAACLLGTASALYCAVDVPLPAGTTANFTAAPIIRASFLGYNIPITTNLLTGKASITGGFIQLIFMGVNGTCSFPASYAIKGKNTKAWAASLLATTLGGAGYVPFSDISGTGIAAPGSLPAQWGFTAAMAQIASGQSMQVIPLKMGPKVMLKPIIAKLSGKFTVTASGSFSSFDLTNAGLEATLVETPFNITGASLQFVKKTKTFVFDATKAKFAPVSVPGKPVGTAVYQKVIPVPTTGWTTTLTATMSFPFKSSATLTAAYTVDG